MYFIPAQNPLSLQVPTFFPKFTDVRPSGSSEMASQSEDQDIDTTIKIIDDEVLELKKQESNLLAHLHLLQDTIARKQARSGKLKNSRIPVYRLPNEILLACLNQAVRSWLTESTETDERMTTDCVESDYRPEGPIVFPCTHTPAIAHSHVSHHWRQIATNMSSLWTNLAVATRHERQLNIPQLRDYIDRAKSMPVTLTFRNLRWSGMLCSTQLSAIVPLVQQQQITGLTFLDSAPILCHILDSGGEQRLASFPSGTFRPARLKSLLSAMPQLKSLGLGLSCWAHTYYYDDQIDAELTIHLPMLETMTIIDWSSQMQQFLRSLSAPALRQFKLLLWYSSDDQNVSCLFIKDVPRFPNVQHLVFFSRYPFNREITEAFAGITHLTLRCHGTIIDDEDDEDIDGEDDEDIDDDNDEDIEVFWPTDLQYLTLDFAFEEIIGNRGFRVTGLQPQEDRPEHPLQISVFDSSEVINERILFQCYKELQQYGSLEGPRVDEFRQWQADGAPEPEDIDAVWMT
ncbi:hypothetical protein BJ138DRAFT_1141017 [Hygrophoropsis aurantiaca]|uniref:Uncharacterized protein n=1 Tax=Hygrophoropsis aurantiaca TaxID=72124 RepID=A0ACB8ARB9_9AGAM|nr:hypothetical protein BJ138DRAFT_1141017 [Hygrophoropsis aurantiaca]